MLVKIFVLVMVAALSVRCGGQDTKKPVPAPQHEANFDEERKQANDLFVAGKILESLPLYEDLCRQDQTIAVFAERYGSGLLRKAPTLKDPAAQKAMTDAGMAEIRRAQALGDNSALVQTILSAGSKSVMSSAMTGLPITVGYSYQGNAAAQPVMKEAEAAFGREDVEGALKLYLKAAELDPQWYSAALFVGDAYYRLHDVQNAGIWFQKAIAIDPDRDTAYRYWGDALYKSGQADAAKVKYENAVVAEPYAKPGWLSLQQWANVTHTQLAVPQVAIPKYTAPNGVLAQDAALKSSTGDGRAAWIQYEECRVKHDGTNNKFSFSVGNDGSTKPNGQYHSLAEETECLRATLKEMRTMLMAGTVTLDGLDRSLKTLDALDKAGMLECWILLSNADMQVRFDYPAYRKEHREQLLAYIDRYIVQAKTK